jgi:hypothetical protein
MTTPRQPLTHSPVAGNYIVVFDPLDGSSNIDAGISVGSIFGIYSPAEGCSLEDADDATQLMVCPPPTLPLHAVSPHQTCKQVSYCVTSRTQVNLSCRCRLSVVQRRHPSYLTNPRPLPPLQEKCVMNVCQPGNALLCAGYCLYSSASIMVLTIGTGVFGFTLDPLVGEFVLTHDNIKIPEVGKIYSFNEGNFDLWDQPTRDYITSLKAPANWGGKPYSVRPSALAVLVLEQIAGCWHASSSIAATSSSEHYVGTAACVVAAVACCTLSTTYVHHNKPLLCQLCALTPASSCCISVPLHRLPRG